MNIAVDHATLPGIPPTDRTPRAADGWVSIFAPGQYAGSAAEFRVIVGSFDNNRDPDTRNAVVHAGWNYTSGFAQIDQSVGSIGDSWENSWQPPQVEGDTWSERHWHFTPPGGALRRPLSMYGSWVTGETGLTIATTHGSLQFVNANGQQKTELLNWSSTAMNVGGDGFWYAANGKAHNRQINGDGTRFVNLPYVDGDEVVIGFDPGVLPDGATPQVRVRSVRYVETVPSDVPTPPAGSATVFLDSATGTFGIKRTDGTVSHLAEI